VAASEPRGGDVIAFGGSLWDVITAEATYSSTMRFSTLLAFAAIGEWIAERAGTINISIEGMILTGAFTAALGSDLSGNVWIGLLFGICGGLIVGFVQGTMSHRFGTNQFVVGLTLNVLAIGLTAFIDAQVEPVVTSAGVLRIPGLADIPLVGDALFNATWIQYLLYPLVPLAWWVMYRTRWGLELRCAGENPQAGDVSGIDINKRRRQAVYVCGLCAGLAGAYLTLGQTGSFTANGVSGRGFIALAAVIFGGWSLKGTLGGALVFGFFSALGSVFQALGFKANAQLLVALPFVMALATMLLFAHRSRQPAALARPFVRGLT
jgi:general nucleoside transport system permease protein